MVPESTGSVGVTIAPISIAAQEETLRSELLDIKGIGPKTAQSLLQTFGSVKRIRDLDEATLAEKVGPAKAGKVARYFAKNGADGLA
jgi:excinuclease ABC subunit C